MFSVSLQAPPFLFGKSSDRSVDRSFVLINDPIDQSEIFFLDQLFLKLTGELPMNFYGLCDDDQARRLLVQPVDKARTDESAIRNRSVQMKHQRIEQCAILVAVSWMDQHSSRLVHHDQVFVLEYNFEWNVLRLHCRLARRIKFDLNKVPASDAKTDILRSAVYLALFGTNYIAKIQPAEAGKLIEQIIFEPGLWRSVGNLDLDLVHWRILAH